MLGTLAKWLRILGFDAHFDQTMSDQQLVRLCRAEGRVLLTRDTELARRRGLRVLLVTAEDLGSQVRQVLGDLELEQDRSVSRCPVCNMLLEPIDHDQARSRVPAYVAETHQEFRHCPRCQRIYWRGTHWEQMEQRLKQLLPSADNDQDPMEANSGTD